MPTEIKLPELGENLEGGQILDLKAGAGDMVGTGQPLLEIEAEKSTVEVPSPVAGRLAKWLVKKGDDIKVGQPFCLIEAGQAQKEEAAKPAAAGAEPRANEAAPAKPPPTAAKAHPETAKPQAVAQSETLVPAGPATRRLARELGVDLGRVTGSARVGRVTQDDVKAYVRQLTAGGGRAPQTPALPDFERWGPVERVPLDTVRRRTAEHMSLSWSQVPHVTHNDLADITELEGLRKRQGAAGPKFTVTAVALKAAVIALKQFPSVNASLDAASGQLIRKRYYHLGVAVDTERGLLVPVVRDVDKKSILTLAQELADLAERARQKKLQIDDMRGGTFTISNLGGIGGTGFSPIVNWPEVAILGLSRARLQPVIREGQVVPRLLLPLSLSYDHRVIDGAEAARFTRRLAELLEEPFGMLVLL